LYYLQKNNIEYLSDLTEIMMCYFSSCLLISYLYFTEQK